MITLKQSLLLHRNKTKIYELSQIISVDTSVLICRWGAVDRLRGSKCAVNRVFNKYFPYNDFVNKYNQLVAQEYTGTSHSDRQISEKDMKFVYPELWDIYLKALGVNLADEIAASSPDVSGAKAKKTKIDKVINQTTISNPLYGMF